MMLAASRNAAPSRDRNLRVAEMSSARSPFQKNLPHKEKEQGAVPCSENCVDPISPQSWI